MTPASVSDTEGGVGGEGWGVHAGIGVICGECRHMFYKADKNFVVVTALILIDLFRAF